jgi:pyruvate dehydrogenase E2 component (dihydrolipoamide acetyltransferase)
VLVGYGPRTTTAGRRPRISTRAAAPTTPAAPAAPVAARIPAPVPPVPPVPETARDLMPAVAAAPAVAHVLAKPPVRKLARDLGITLAEVAPSGPGGVITREDVEAYRRAATATVLTGTVAAPTAAAERPGSRETRTPIKGVRKATAAAMVSSAFTAPHVTEWVQVDVTRTVKLLDRLRADRTFEGVRISPLLLVARALLVAVRRNPGVNATWDEQAQEIVVKHYVNLGIAAATPRGLVVPNVKDADRLTLRELADALAALTATAREGRTQPADTAGGTVTVTNVGVFGIDAGTPILNPGEAAILAVGQVRRMPWVHKGKVKPRWVTTLALSFDHRLVDGDLGSRTLADVAAVLEDPAKALAWS